MIPLINKPENFNINDPAHITFLGQRIGELFAMPMIKHRMPTIMPEQIKQLQNFVTTDPKTHKLQMMSTPDDFPAYLLNLFNEFQQLTIYDDGYERIYDVRPLTGKDGYDIYTTENNFVSEKILPGGRIYYKGSAGARYRSYIDFYGGGHGIDHRLLLTKDFYRIQKDLLALRNASYLKKAQVAYALIEIIVNTYDTAWQAHPDAVTSGNVGYQVGRDVQTMNVARQTIITNTLTKKDYWPQGLATPLQILAPYQLEGRVNRALKYNIGDKDSSTDLLGNWAQPIFSTLLTVSTDYYVILPGAKLTGAVLLNLTQFNNFNQDNFTTEIANWLAYSFNVGDIVQVSRCKTS